MSADQVIVGDQNPLMSFFIFEQPLIALCLTFGGMLLLMMIEQLVQREPETEVPVSRWLSNWLLGLLNFFAMLWLLAYTPLGMWLHQIFSRLTIGAVAGTALSVVAFVLIVEFLDYWVHRAMHRVPLLWRIHAVHHCDGDVDVTTSQRHHFLEVAITALVITPPMLILGVPLWAAAAYQLLRVVLTLFNHGKLTLPDALNRGLRPFVVTPSFHRVHHSAEHIKTNSNYGTVVPWFDFLFGTATARSAEAEPSRVGLDELHVPSRGRVDQLLLLPFMWRRWQVESRN